MTTGLSPHVRWPGSESLDGLGAADHDCPYTFARLRRAMAPFPFSTRQFARLLVLRKRVRAGDLVHDPCISGATPDIR